MGAEIISIGGSSSVCADDCERKKPALGEVMKTNLPKVVLQSKAGFVETTKYDDEGNIIVNTLRKQRYQNGSGFVISYTAKMCDFITATKQGSVVRLFLYLAHNQQYGTDGKTFGYRCSHKYLQTVLGVDKKTIYNAISYLKEQFLVVETREDGISEFMVNPNYVTIGTDKKTRLRVWNDRWALIMKDKGVKTLARLSSGQV